MNPTVAIQSCYAISFALHAPTLWNKLPDEEQALPQLGPSLDIDFCIVGVVDVN